MGRLIDADHVKDFFFSETSGTEDVIRDLMDTHGMDYANDINEEVIMAFAKDLLKAVQNVIDTEPTAFDLEKVVEQLDKASDYYEFDEQGMEHVQMLRLVDAIEIVKGSVRNRKECKNEQCRNNSFRYNQKRNTEAER